MKYYVLQAEQYNDGTKDSIGVYTYEDRDTAIANFHSRLGVSMKNEKVAHVLCAALDENGDDMRREAWTRPVVVVEEPEATEEDSLEEKDGE